MSQIDLCAYKLNFCFLGIIASNAVDPAKVKRAYLSVSVDGGVGSEVGVRQWEGWGEELMALDGINQDRGLTGRNRFTKGGRDEFSCLALGLEFWATYFVLMCSKILEI